MMSGSLWGALTLYVLLASHRVLLWTPLLPRASVLPVWIFDRLSALRVALEINSSCSHLRASRPPLGPGDTRKQAEAAQAQTANSSDKEPKATPAQQQRPEAHKHHEVDDDEGADRAACLLWLKAVTEEAGVLRPSPNFVVIRHRVASLVAAAQELVLDKRRTKRRYSVGGAAPPRKHRRSICADGGGERRGDDESTSESDPEAAAAADSDKQLEDDQEDDDCEDIDDDYEEAGQTAPETSTFPRNRRQLVVLSSSPLLALATAPVDEAAAKGALLCCYVAASSPHPVVHNLALPMRPRHLRLPAMLMSSLALEPLLPTQGQSSQPPGSSRPGVPATMRLLPLPNSLTLAQDSAAAADSSAPQRRPAQTQAGMFIQTSTNIYFLQLGWLRRLAAVTVEAACGWEPWVEPTAHLLWKRSQVDRQLGRRLAGLQLVILPVNCTEGNAFDALRRPGGAADDPPPSLMQAQPAVLLSAVGQALATVLPDGETGDTTSEASGVGTSVPIFLDLCTALRDLPVLPPPRALAAQDEAATSSPACAAALWLSQGLHDKSQQLFTQLRQSRQMEPAEYLTQVLEVIETLDRSVVWPLRQQRQLLRRLATAAAARAAALPAALSEIAAACVRLESNRVRLESRLELLGNKQAETRARINAARVFLSARVCADRLARVDDSLLPSLLCAKAVGVDGPLEALLRAVPCERPRVAAAEDDEWEEIAAKPAGRTYGGGRGKKERPCLTKSRERTGKTTLASQQENEPREKREHRDADEQQDTTTPGEEGEVEEKEQEDPVAQAVEDYAALQATVRETRMRHVKCLQQTLTLFDPCRRYTPDETDSQQRALQVTEGTG
eukprot:GHVT01005363.1.p1 GENE.GHVT01005363.1~~GHVT01005363.1.p1  ORF type:complete len:843 (+),score=248.01 GHVT01005363.1:953-3481(+)